MATILNFFDRKRRAPAREATTTLGWFLDGFSIEVTPRTASKVQDFRELLPAGTRVYIAHVDGTPIADMVATAARLRAEGFEPMPHLPARSIADRATLDDWLGRYRGEADATSALLIAGGRAQPAGAFDSSMQVMETGLLDARGFTRLHVAGHPEGNRDIDPDGSDRAIGEALRWKQAFSERTDATMAITTQFCFEAEPVIAWAEGLRANGIALPVHIGVAGPAKLQTLIKYALACGVGPSIRVLQKRAMDMTRLMLPHSPEEFLRALAARKAADPAFAIEAVHFFPLGGVAPVAEFTEQHRMDGDLRRMRG
jgi:methylenetetrahydrofolate reductase (NADPH)